MNDPALEADALKVWATPGVLPDGKQPEERLKELAMVAYEDGQLAALATLSVDIFPYVRQKFAFIRGYVLPEFRMKTAGRDIMKKTQEMIEAWAYRNPEEQLAGMAAIIQVPGVGKNPIGQSTGLVLVGYTNKMEQVRVAWFDHFRVPLNMSESEFQHLTGAPS